MGATSLRHPKETQVVRIALTGGPCAGKSSALEHIIEAAKEDGYDVYTAPETATLIFNCGNTFPTTPEGVFKFQQSLARWQLAMERSLTRLAGITGRPSIIIFDRGLLDAKGYMDDASWNQLMIDVGAGGDGHVNGINEEYILKRYDAVIHLVTAAEGAEEFYKWGRTVDDSGNIVIRMETPEQARELDRRMQEVWANHKRHVIIKNTAAGFKAKLDEASTAVVSVANLKHRSK